MSFEHLGAINDQLDTRRLKAVLGKSVTMMSDGSTSCDEIAFVVDGHCLHVAVNFDTDEVVLNVLSGESPLGDDWTSLNDLVGHIGEPFGWFWGARNHQGYADMLLLAFGDVVPEVLNPRLALLGEGSAISLLRLTRL